MKKSELPRSFSPDPRLYIKLLFSCSSALILRLFGPAHLGAGRLPTCWRTWVEAEPLLPSPPVGTRGTGGPGRAGTAAAEELLLGWTEGEEEVQTVRGGDEEVEEGETAGEEDEAESPAEAGWEGARPRFDSGCSGSGGREEGRWRERGRDVGPGRDEEAGEGGAAQRWRQEVAERTGPGSPQAGTEGGTGPETGAGGGSQRPGSDGGRSGPQSGSGASMFGLGAETGGSGSHSGSERTGFGSGTPEDEPGTGRPDSAGSEVQPGQVQYLSKNLREEKMKTSQKHSDASR